MDEEENKWARPEEQGDAEGKPHQGQAPLLSYLALAATKTNKQTAPHIGVPRVCCVHSGRQGLHALSRNTKNELELPGNPLNKLPYGKKNTHGQFKDTLIKNTLLMLKQGRVDDVKKEWFNLVYGFTIHSLLKDLSHGREKIWNNELRLLQSLAVKQLRYELNHALVSSAA